MNADPNIVNRKNFVAAYTRSPMPPADEEVHRHEDELEEDEEHEQVEAEEGAHHPGFEQEHPREVRLLVVVRIRREERQREQDSGEHDEQQRDPVDTDEPGDPPVLDPLVLGDELEASLAAVEGGDQPEAHRAGDDCRQPGDQLDEIGSASRGITTSAPAAGATIRAVRIGKLATIHCAPRPRHDPPAQLPATRSLAVARSHEARVYRAAFI